YRPDAADFLADEHLKKGAAGSATAGDILQKSEGGAFKLTASEISELYEKSAIAAKAKAMEKDVGKDIEEVASLDSPLEGVSPAATSPAIDADMVVVGGVALDTHDDQWPTTEATKRATTLSEDQRKGLESAVLGYLITRAWKNLLVVIHGSYVREYYPK
ncbi:hypothetical protein FOZ62_011949, partial [Perkinsus olseni]